MRPAMMKVPFLAFVPVVAAGALWAQDPVKVAPKNFKVLLENDHVRVLDFHSKSGEKIPMHSHPAYVAYAVAGSGKTKFTSPDGKTTEVSAKAGQTTWRDAETHASEYTGVGETHVVLFELKEEAGKPKP
jgi:quercetin dioxygenase-like cupin family protein